MRAALKARWNFAREAFVKGWCWLVEVWNHIALALFLFVTMGLTAGTFVLPQDWPWWSTPGFLLAVTILLFSQGAFELWRDEREARLRAEGHLIVTTTGIDLHDLRLDSVECKFVNTVSEAVAQYALYLGNRADGKLHWWVRSLRATFGERAVQFKQPPGGTAWDGVMGRGDTATFYFPEIRDVSLEGPLRGTIEVLLEYGDVGQPPRFRNDKRLKVQVFRHEQGGIPAHAEHIVESDIHEAIY